MTSYTDGKIVEKVTSYTRGRVGRTMHRRKVLIVGLTHPTVMIQRVMGWGAMEQDRAPGQYQGAGDVGTTDSARPGALLPPPASAESGV